MLSGARDEVVPKEHMRLLWEIVAKRGEMKTSGGKEFKVGLERAKFKEFEYGTHSKLTFSTYLGSTLNPSYEQMILACSQDIGLPSLISYLNAPHNHCWFAI
jgi:hypothetical protein